MDINCRACGYLLQPSNDAPHRFEFNGNREKFRDVMENVTYVGNPEDWFPLKNRRRHK
jgi:hypothetical protein